MEKSISKRVKIHQIWERNKVKKGRHPYVVILDIGEAPPWSQEKEQVKIRSWDIEKSSEVGTTFYMGSKSFRRQFKYVGVRISYLITDETILKRIGLHYRNKDNPKYVIVRHLYHSTLTDNLMGEKNILIQQWDLKHNRIQKDGQISNFVLGEDFYKNFEEVSTVKKNRKDKRWRTLVSGVFI